MKKLKYILIVIFPLFGSKCETEGENCHRIIEVKNNSLDSVIYALQGTNEEKCILVGDLLEPSKLRLRDNRYCWEDVLSTGKTFDFYIVDPDQFNQGGKFYDCDSIPIKNKILKEYKLSLIDLQRVDFKISYP